MTNPHKGNQMVRAPGGPGLAALCSYFGYVIWKHMELSRMRKRGDELHEDFMRRAVAISEETDELVSLITGEPKKGTDKNGLIPKD